MTDTEETPEIPEPWWPATHSEPLPKDKEWEENCESNEPK